MWYCIGSPARKIVRSLGLARAWGSQAVTMQLVL
jgi:hypothetical protein